MGLISDYIAMSLLDRATKLVELREAPGGTNFESRISKANDNQVEKYFIGLGGGNIAQLLDDAIAASELPTKMDTFMARLQQHYSEIGGRGYLTLAAALATRAYRLHRKLAALYSSYAFPSAWQFDDEVNLGTFVYLGSFTAGSNLSAAVESGEWSVRLGPEGSAGPPPGY